MTSELQKLASNPTRTHRLLVCTTCASTWQNGQQVGVSGGEKLLQEISQRSQDWELRSQVEIKAVKCMSACSHACVVAFAADNKYTYVFGGLPNEAEELPIATAAIFACVEKYCDRPDGILAWAERPEPLKRGLIARIPPCSPILD